MRAGEGAGTTNAMAPTEGPVNYDVFAAFNRVIDGSYRSGTGAREVKIRLVTP